MSIHEIILRFTKPYSSLAALGLGDEKALFFESLGNWHSLEHIMYNMLVEVFRTNPSKFSSSNVYPELALLNAEDDVISKDVQALRSLSFVNPKFEPVRPRWFADHREETVIRQIKVERRLNISVLEELMPQSRNVTADAEKYRWIFLHNLELFRSIVEK